MAKKKVKKSVKKSRLNRIPKVYFVFGIFGIVILGIAINSVFFTEDLGPQLPPPPADSIYKQADQPIDARVSDLMSRMTLEEKIGQMSLVDKNSLKKDSDISKYNLGAVLSGAGAKPTVNTAEGWAELANIYKTEASKSRLNIPIFYGVDANHGHANVPGATVFPHEIGLGASNNPELVQKVAQATSSELSATGINWNYTPSLDAPKDIRWGRVYEAFSDNVDIISKLGASYIKGTQQNTGIISSAKHYVATGSMGWETSNHKTYKIDHGKVIEDETALRQYYLPPYKAAVDAGVASIMIGLTEYGNNRVIDSKYLMTDILKNEFGYKGFLVSDWYGVNEYAQANDYDANVKTINAGLDMAMLPFDYKGFLKDMQRAVNKDDIPIERINDAVSRILYQKFKAGLFDNRDKNPKLEEIGSQTHRDLARKAVSSSSVLLKNNSSILPLNKNSNEILVAGSGADNIGRQTGAWTVEWQGIDGNWLPGATSILSGIKQTVSPDTSVRYSLDGNFEESQKAKVGIVVVSEKPYAEGYGDNNYPTISKEDILAIENMHKSADKIVVLILSGRPIFISDYLNDWDSVVASWLPGSEGSGISDVLFGNEPFTAKLTLPWPANVAQLPINNNGSTNDGTEPLFPQGFGL